MSDSHERLEAGQAITCDAGHTIATATEPLELGKPGSGWIEKMRWEQPVPNEGDAAECAVCGKPWMIRPDDGSSMAWVCVDGRWEPPLDKGARAFLAQRRARH